MSILKALNGQALFDRALRGSAITALGYVASQGLRLASNLILARLLFPEAFGLMALVTVVLVGLAMFSDVGIGPAISRSPRGDDPAFLNTAWTMHVIRGVMLWLTALALAWPLAWFYEAPDLRNLLPVAGISLLIAGFNPTRIETANRHLLLGRACPCHRLCLVPGAGGRSGRDGQAGADASLAARPTQPLFLGARLGARVGAFRKVGISVNGLWLCPVAGRPADFGGVFATRQAGCL